MKRILLGCLMVLFLCGTAWGQRITVTKDSAGTMTGVTAYVTASGVTVWEATATGVSIYASAWNNLPVTISVLTDYTDAAAFAGVTGFSLPTDTHTGPVTGLVSGAVQSNEIVYGGASKYYVYSGATLTADQLAGGMIYSHAAAPIVLGIPAITGSTPFFLVTDMTGSGVTIQTTDGETIYDGDDSGSFYWIDAGNHRHSVSMTLNYESGASAYGIVLGTTGANWTIE